MTREINFLDASFFFLWSCAQDNSVHWSWLGIHLRSLNNLWVFFFSYCFGLVPTTERQLWCHADDLWSRELCKNYGIIAACLFFVIPTIEQENNTAVFIFVPQVTSNCFWRHSHHSTLETKTVWERKIQLQIIYCLLVQSRWLSMVFNVQWIKIIVCSAQGQNEGRTHN